MKVSISSILLSLGSSPWEVLVLLGVVCTGGSTPLTAISVRSSRGGLSVGLSPPIADDEGTLDDSALVLGVQIQGVPDAWSWDDDENLSGRVSTSGISILIGRPSQQRSMSVPRSFASCMD